MTLYINVIEASKLPQGGYLVVEGSRAGLLASKEIGTNQRFSPPFLIKCASDDVLTFKLAPSLKGYQNGEVLSYGTIHGPVLTKRYRNQLSSFVPHNSSVNISQLKNNDGEVNRTSQIRSSELRQTQSNLLNYEVELTNKNQQSGGVLSCLIGYDKVSHFEGEFCTGPQKQAMMVGQKVAMFKGKCPTKNLFSLLDPACEGQQKKFIESIYKDGPEQYVL